MHITKGVRLFLQLDMRSAIFLVAVVPTIGSRALAQDTSLREVKKAFDDANIPDDLGLPFNPEALLEVTFRQSDIIPPITVRAGIHLSQNVTAHQPTYRLLSTPVVPASRRRPDGISNPKSQIVIPAAVGNGPFVLAIVDPDAPSPRDPKNAQYRHFLGGGFVLRNLGLVLANRTPAITEFAKPSPPDGSDPHRYIFLLFKEPEGFQDQREVTPDTSRAKFNVSSFAENVGLGHAVAGTYMWVGPGN